MKGTPAANVWQLSLKPIFIDPQREYNRKFESDENVMGFRLAQMPGGQAPPAGTAGFHDANWEPGKWTMVTQDVADWADSPPGWSSGSPAWPLVTIPDARLYPHPDADVHPGGDPGAYTMATRVKTISRLRRPK